MTEATAPQPEPVDDVDAALMRALDGMTYERPRPRQYLVKLEGQHKLATMCWLVAGDHSLLVEAFVMRRPDEDHQRLYDLLLTRNGRMYGVAWAIDDVGDVFLVGRLPLSAISGEEVDRLLGSVLSYADETFDTMLEIGFGTSIRREWAWRSKNGESLANLQAFARFADPEGRSS
ncbi:MAG: YbjN domain-containing protein [Mycobacteriales bacterium]